MAVSHNLRTVACVTELWPYDEGFYEKPGSFRALQWGRHLLCFDGMGNLLFDYPIALTSLDANTTCCTCCTVSQDGLYVFLGIYVQGKSTRFFKSPQVLCFRRDGSLMWRFASLVDPDALKCVPKYRTKHHDLHIAQVKYGRSSTDLMEDYELAVLIHWRPGSSLFHLNRDGEITEESLENLFKLQESECKNATATAGTGILAFWKEVMARLGDYLCSKGKYDIAYRAYERGFEILAHNPNSPTYSRMRGRPSGLPWQSSFAKRHWKEILRADIELRKTENQPKPRVAKQRSYRQRLRAEAEQEVARLREAENTVREHYGVPRIGEGWVAETELYQLVRSLFPGLDVRHRARPDWLKPQELDVYIPSLKLAIEYMGEQHYKARDYFWR